ncbi:unnamed protein product [Urochloa decumbens]|uniref:Mitochondrial pyruvate carrier n=2 Tax=Urochloa decumbens TaxID=240449 RepID=A0ABC9BBY6_9POAL
MGWAPQSPTSKLNNPLAGERDPRQDSIPEGDRRRRPDPAPPPPLLPPPSPEAKRAQSCGVCLYSLPNLNLWGTAEDLGGNCALVLMAATKLQALWNHPAGPKTIHFWAPTFKWGISIANIADFAKPPEKISYPQQVAVACTGLVWSRYSLVITPKNWNLFSVNVAMAGTGLYQLSRKIRQDYLSGEKEAAPQLEA